MIRIFKSKKLLFTPTEWMNSVARWLLGIHSPTGTIRIRNTANPSEDGGAEVDIDPSETFKAIEPHLRSKYVKVLDTKLLGASLKWNGGQLEVDDNWLKARVIDNDSVDPTESGSLPEDISDEASRGTATKAARFDHVHKLNCGNGLETGTNADDETEFKVKCKTNGGLEATSDGLAISVSSDGLLFCSSGTISSVTIGTGSDQVAAGDHTHDEYALTDHDHAGVYAPLIHSHAGYALSDHDHDGIYATIDHDHNGIYATIDHDHDSDYQAKSSKLTSLESQLDSEGKVPLTQLTGNIDGHGGNCFVTIANDGSLGHSTNVVYNAVQALKADYEDAGNSIPYADFGSNAHTSGKVVETTSDGKLTETSNTYGKFSNAPSGSKWVKTSGNDGELVEASADPLVADSTFASNGIATCAFDDNGNKIIKSVSSTLNASSTIWAITNQSIYTDQTTGFPYLIITIRQLDIDATGVIKGFKGTSHTIELMANSVS